MPAMDPALYSLALATLAFVGGHFMLSSAPVRGPLVGMIGEKPFEGVYTVIVLAAFVWMIFSYNDVDYRRLWDVGAAGPWIAVVLMFFGAIFFVCSVTTKNPTMSGTDITAASPGDGRGIFTVTRHPMLVSFALWGAAHLIARGDAAGVFLFGGVFVLAAGGMIHLDARRRARATADGDTTWHAFEAGTSRTPFLAILDGRHRLSLSEIGWWRIGAGIVLFVVLMAVHELAFGLNPLRM